MKAPKSNRPVNVEVVSKPGEPPDKLIRRFLKKCKKENIVKEHLGKVSYFKNKREKKREKMAKSRKFKYKFEKK